jgi:hypothetical protein
MSGGSFRSPARTTALVGLLGIAIANLSLQPLTEPDFGWHLRTGLDLLRQGLVLPSSDPYSHTMPDWKWVEHAWLTDVIIAAVYTRGGGLSVALLFAVITAGAWLLAARPAPCGWLSRVFACMLSLWVALPYLGARTQLISLLGLAILLNLLSTRRERVRAWNRWLPPLFLVWANLHGGFTAGLFLLGLVVGASSVMRFTLTQWPGLAPYLDEEIVSVKEIRHLIFLTGVSGILTLVNPYGWRLHSEILTSLSDRYMLETLHEWQALSLDSYAGRSYALYLGGLALAMAAWYRRIEPVRWVLWAAFLALSLRHMRNIPVFLIVSLPLFADVTATGIRQLAGRFAPGMVSRRWWAAAGTAAVGCVLLWLGPEHLRNVAESGLRPAEYFKRTSYPIEAVQWIQLHRDRVGHRLYNDYGHGGFLLWWLPGEKIFIDGRMPTWRAGERRILEDYVALTASVPPALFVLAKYSVDWAIVPRQSLLEEALEREAGWDRVYEDTKVSVYVLSPP